MAKHKLDTEVEDLLQHFGVKGMKWGVKRSEEELAGAEGGEGGGGGGGEEEEEDEEEDESLLDELKDGLENLEDTLKGAMGKTLGSISDAIKKEGEERRKKEWDSLRVVDLPINKKLTNQVRNQARAQNIKSKQGEFKPKDTPKGKGKIGIFMDRAKRVLTTYEVTSTTSTSRVSGTTTGESTRSEKTKKYTRKYFK